MSADLSPAAQALMTAQFAPSPVERFAAAQLAALRVASAVLAVRTRPVSARRSPNAWQLLARCAPQYAEWAGHFEFTQRQVAALRRSAHPVMGARRAEDHLRDAQQFYLEVERWLTAEVAATAEVRASA